MQDFDVQYQRLNAAQKEAVDTIEGPVVVIAGPGTGKTQILTLRIATILKNAGAGIGPENILALTFTRAGEAAMRARLATFIGAADAYRAHIFTFHSFCERQIMDHPDYFPHIAFARLVDDVQRLTILTDIVRDGDFALIKTFGSDTHYIGKLAEAIGKIKSAGIDPEAFAAKVEGQKSAIMADPASYYQRNCKSGKKGDLRKDALKGVEKNREVARVYAAYQDALHAKKVYDFADMIVETVRAVERDEDFAALLRERYQYILVDEHQDTNDGQNRLVDLLLTSPYGDDAPNIFTVGDDKQAIYRFQGASVENFHHVTERFAGTKVIHLETNYRATQDLLDEAHAMITCGGANAAHHALTAYTAEHGHARILRYRTYGDEVRGIVEDVHMAIDRGAVPRDIAILCRGNHEARELAQMCEKMQIPYVLGEKHNVLDNPLVRALVRLLYAIDAPMDDERFAAALLTPLSQVPMREVLVFLNRARMAKDDRALCEYATDSAWMVREMHDDGAHVATFAQQLVALKALSVTMPLAAFVEHVTRASACVELLASQRDHAAQFKDFARLMEVIIALAQQHTAYELTELMAYFDTCEAYGVAITTGEPADHDGVQIMTAHAAKGLEFDHVYIAHATHRTWGGRREQRFFDLPINTVVSDDDDERRLFYVALTRARRSVTITHAQFDVNGKPLLPTMFVEHSAIVTTDTAPKNDARSDFAPRLRPVVSLVDPNYIRERFLATPLSATAMNNYFLSPLLYFFRTIVRLPTAPSKSLLFGNVLHGTLEQFSRAVTDTGATPSVEEMVALFHERLRRARVPRLYRKEFETRGEEVLRGYYKEHVATFVPTSSAEQRITGVPFTLDDGTEILLTGAIDKITPTDDGRIVVTDYKSGASWSDKSNPLWRKGLERQIRFYKLLLDNDPQATHPPIAYGEIVFIEPRRKNGVYETKQITVTDDDVRLLKEEIVTMARSILSGTFLDTPIAAPTHNDREVAYYLRLLHEMQRSTTQSVV